MKKKMNPNSLEVYYNEVFPTLAPRQKRVAEVVTALEKCTCYEVAKMLNVFPSQISGRFSELVKKGTLKVVGTIKKQNRPHAIYALNYSSGNDFELT